MSKTPLLVMVGSGVIIVISLMMIGFGTMDIDEIDVQSEAIFQGTSGTFQAETFGGYTIFVNDQFTCEETTVSITDGTDEVYVLDCDSDFDEVGWRAIGVIDVETPGQLSVTANNEIIIIDDLVYGTEGAFLMMAGGGLCCIGIIGLVVGIVMASKMKGEVSGQHVIVQSQQPIQSQEGQEQFPPISP